MSSFRAQASTELVSIMAVSLLVVFLFIVFAWESLSDVDARQDFNNAHHAVLSLADAANQVYAQGPGSSKIVFITIPSGAELGENYSYIGTPAFLSGVVEPKQITIRYAGSDISAYTKASVHGSFPSKPGSYNMEVVSKGDVVVIQPNLIDIDKSTIYIVMPNDESRSEQIRLFKAVSEDVLVNVSAAWRHEGVNFVFSPTSFYANLTGSAIQLSFSASGANANRFYNSALVIYATGQSSGALERIEIPISVLVQAG
ncbi:MAG: hypothetical protein QW275_02005 [Candidatus Anstonellaceae archaeon]